MTARTRRAVRTGQALVEFTLVLPVAVLLVLGTMAIWSSAHRAGVYGDAALGLAEWIGRTGTYTARMRTATTAALDGSLVTSSAASYLHILVQPPAGGSTRIGSAPPSVAGTPPASSGWGGTLADLPDGSTVTVEIYGYDTFWFGIAAIPRERVVVGRAVWEVNTSQ